jgi:folate-binding protein YgfZ
MECPLPLLFLPALHAGFSARSPDPPLTVANRDIIHRFDRWPREDVSMVANPLDSIHEQAEAAFLPYGPELRIVESFGEVEAEYAAIRKSVALLDAPHRGVMILTGKDRLAFLNNLLTNELKTLVPGQGAYAYLLNTKGRITLDVNVLHAEDATLLEMDARYVEGLSPQLERFHFSEDVAFIDGSPQLARLSVIGPRSALLLDRLTDGGASALTQPLSSTKRQLRGITVTLFRLEQCGELQFELIVPRDQVVAIWQHIQEAGGDHHHDAPATTGADAPAPPPGETPVRAIGWSAFNTARIESGTPLFGIDLSDHYLPMETNRWYPRAVAVSKGCYLGQEIVARMHAHKTVARLLVGLRVEGSRLPVAGTDILVNGQQVGILTSSCMSPMLGNVPVAMGYVKKAVAAVGTAVELLAEGLPTTATVSDVPFWTPTR